MPTVLASPTLANGLLNTFWDTYAGVIGKAQSSVLGQVMDIPGVGATNREHSFSYFNAPPHMEYWRRGDPIPEGAMDSTSFTVKVYEFAKRVPWFKWDRKDDQTQSLFDVVKMLAKNAGNIPERLFFDCLTGTATTLPAVPLAPDGAAFFATTAGGSARFGVTSGNLLTGTAPTTTAIVLTDYYAAMEQFGLFQDGQGQPLFGSEVVGEGVIILHSIADTKIMEETFLQRRQGGVMGTDAGVTPSNIVQDASRNVQLWGSPRIATGDWYVFLKGAPKKPTFILNREGLKEYASLESDNNGDIVRTTAIESVQWEMRIGAGIALPYGAIKINS